MAQLGIVSFYKPIIIFCNIVSCFSLFILRNAASCFSYLLYVRYIESVIAYSKRFINKFKKNTDYVTVSF